MVIVERRVALRRSAVGRSNRNAIGTRCETLRRRASRTRCETLRRNTVLRRRASRTGSESLRRNSVLRRGGKTVRAGSESLGRNTVLRRGSEATGLTHGRSNEGLKVTTSPVGGATGAFPAVRAVVAAVVNNMILFDVATTGVSTGTDDAAHNAEDETENGNSDNPTNSHAGGSCRGGVVLSVVRIVAVSVGRASNNDNRAATVSVSAVPAIAVATIATVATSAVRSPAGVAAASAAATSASTSTASATASASLGFNKGIHRSKSENERDQAEPEYSSRQIGRAHV